ncbi:hypothetical protein H257_17132 [Aphanomyces astaci]|uniref:Thioredoxin domain-containing protein n=1 Tax=Aphanomyces astaci TaxID=112090 RepID=W4FHM8_APHAT|nr:hypothetical protein H257_17132 [Aphanomyces astaci]ETV66331.1 hypothetical protein H257_17132 [Aphanomyces astaci]|eukprot:XP_009844106.1 hypothetical protein H257_17132 [Aphanomyces astaci]
MLRLLAGRGCICLWLFAMVMMAVVAGVPVVDITDISTAHKFTPMLVIAFKSWEPYNVSTIATFIDTATALAITLPDLSFGAWDMSLYPMTSPTGFVVRGYPAYLLFESDATVPRKYIGPATPKAIETWLTNTSPLVEFDSIDEWTCYVAAAQEPIALVVVPDLHSPDRLVAEALAAQSDVGVVALRAYDWAVDGAWGKLGPRLWVYDPVLNTQNLYDGAWSVGLLAAFVVKCQRPWLDVFDPYAPFDYSAHTAHGLLFSDPSVVDTHNDLLRLAEQVLSSKHIRGTYDVSFLLMPSDTSPQLATFFDVTATPAIVWYKDPDTYNAFPQQGTALEALIRQHYPPPGTELAQHLVAFLQSHPTLQSDPSSKEQGSEGVSSAVVEITSMVQLHAFIAATSNSPTAPVAFIAFYSLRCSSCSALLPRLHQLSNQHTQPIVLLATMNVDAVEYQSLVQVVGGTRFSLPAVYTCRNGDIQTRVGTDSSPPSIDDLLAILSDVPILD